MIQQTISRPFHGGIHPPEHKHLSNQAPLRTAPLPEEVVLSLVQHAGRIAEPIVQVGDRVQTGQLLAGCQSGTGACIHASISGEVIAIEPRPMAHPSGLTAPSIVIRSDGQDSRWPWPTLPDWQQASDQQLLAQLEHAGLVGLGGATFPTWIKLEGARKHGIRTLIINAAECEPYITADDLLMRSRPEALLEGIALLERLLQPEQLLLGIEDNKPEALQAIAQAIAGHALESRLKACVLPTRYPSGGEKQLIQLLTGQEVPSGKLPIDLGILCQNVGTLVALRDAVVLGQPLIERVVTLTGQAVRNPGNWLVRLGTPISQLLQLAEADPEQAERLIVGGPMMGFNLDSDQYHVTKGMNCLLLTTAEELPLPGPEQPCIRCGRCEDACPVRLLPQQLYFYAAGGAFDKAEQQQLADCIECGACAWVCPSEIPLVQYYRHAKDQLIRKRADARKADLAKLRFEARKARLEREEQEKETKRRARAEAAAKMAAAKRAASETAENPTPAPATAAATTTATPAPAAENTASAPPTAAAASGSLDDKQLKQLKIARAAAAVAVKKAEKTLANLHTTPDATPEQIQEQQQRVEAAQQQLARAEQRLQDAEQADAATSQEPDR
ncbi:electron transport complex subunit RsxC [Marinospirillum alkaliphilum]|uniref:Ion-translocating oxidoreductase complex subunit C n=1 Tax=Marinospirillum alkaliphilum DSM 21637 TaxID=1122209 RepID=A0A1K1UBH0_9GAMM|nr:electron transport complex subunit RsxC [Marinospirillum alkaliphilum]SFX10170.1 electron transport complex protein RnfC [Marinospirillum alkaliphilum DSM 21637]